MEKRYQVFVSSTYTDLEDERKKVFQTLMEMDCIPAGMELFPAADEEQWDFIRKIINDCDYYLLIIGGRYGSLTTESISYTEKEFDYAADLGLKIVALIHDSPNELSFEKSEENPDLREKLELFKVKVKEGRLVKFWNNPRELPGLVALSLTKTMKAYPAKGWIRADTMASDKANRKILDLQEEIKELTKELDQVFHQAPKGSELLAQGSDTYSLRIKVNYSNAYLGYHDPDRSLSIDFDLTLSWAGIFGMVGVVALYPVRETKLKSHLCAAVKDKYIESLMKHCEEGYRITSVSISESLFQSIKYQLSALGYLKTTQEVMLNKDVEKEINFCELTPYGEKKLIEVRAIHKEGDKTNPDQQGMLTRTFSETDE